eukprot:6665761-Prymnesium_polylepis.1
MSGAVECVRSLLDARADPSIKWHGNQKVNKTSRPAPMGAEGWARYVETAVDARRRPEQTKIVKELTMQSMTGGPSSSTAMPHEGS